MTKLEHRVRKIVGVKHKEGKSRAFRMVYALERNHLAMNAIDRISSNPTSCRNAASCWQEDRLSLQLRMPSSLHLQRERVAPEARPQPELLP